MKGEIKLPSSKSISNRMVLLKHLYEPNLRLENISEANDTVVLQKLLAQEAGVLDVQDAGTVFRFLVAYCAVTEGKWEIRGTDRLHERPISELVNALRSMGADIHYIEKEGCAPLRIRGKALRVTDPIDLTAVRSSQYVSALLMIAPKVEGEFVIKLNKRMNSYSYVQLTIAAMRRMGFSVHVKEGKVAVSNKRKFKGEYFVVEPDWTSFYYWYAIAQLADEVDLCFAGIHQNNMQKERTLLYEVGNDKIHFEDTPEGFRLIKKESGGEIECPAQLDLSQYPDLAPTFAMLFAALNCNKTKMLGLQSLKFKECDREEAIGSHLQKLNCDLLHDGEQWWVDGDFKLQENTQFNTFDDHRMAMCIAPLALLAPIQIENEDVVKKSYPNFWEDLKKVGFEIDYI